MSEKQNRFSYLKKISTFKKVLIVFVTLLIFIIIVEQPGSDSSKRRKNSKYFIPKLVLEEVSRVSIKKPNFKSAISLEKIDDKWRVANGHSFPADVHKIEKFLKVTYSLKQGSMVSNNLERALIFSVDEKTGTHIEMWNYAEHSIADFYAGESIPNGQYLRHADSEEVYQTIPSLISFLSEDTEGWKDKTLLSVEEEDVRKIVLKNLDDEIAIEKEADTGVWKVIQPKEARADDLAIRTLFEQLRLFKADSFADSVDGSQVDFEEPDYKISIKLADDSLKLVLLSVSDENDKYFAKNGDSTFIYIVSKEMVDKVFGLDFKIHDKKEVEESE